MLTLAIGYVVGILSVLIPVRIMMQRECAAKNKFDGTLFNAQRRLEALKASEAYRNGRDFERTMVNLEIQRLNLQLADLQEENELLRGQMDTESIFSSTVAERGGAAVMLRRIPRK